MCAEDNLLNYSRFETQIRFKRFDACGFRSVVMILANFSAHSFSVESQRQSSKAM